MRSVAFGGQRYIAFRGLLFRFLFDGFDQAHGVSLVKLDCCAGIFFSHFIAFFFFISFRCTIIVLEIGGIRGIDHYL